MDIIYIIIYIYTKIIKFLSREALKQNQYLENNIIVINNI